MGPCRRVLGAAGTGDAADSGYPSGDPGAFIFTGCGVDAERDVSAQPGGARDGVHPDDCHGAGMEHDLFVSWIAQRDSGAAARSGGTQRLQQVAKVHAAGSSIGDDRADLEFDDVDGGRVVFLTTVEAFTLKDRDFRLPGLGSYMAEANQHWIDTHDAGPVIAGSVAMIVMIVVFDQVLWRPLVVWSQKFKLEENTEAKTPQSWLLSLFAYSRLLVWIGRIFKSDRSRIRLSFARRRNVSRVASYESPTETNRRIQTFFRMAIIGVAIAAGCYGVVELIMLIMRVPLWQPGAHNDWVTIVLALLASFARTSSAVMLGALWTLPVGIVIGRSPRLSNFFQPVIQTMASYPAPMVFPIVTAALFALHIPFNIGCVALLLLGAQWYVLFNVIAGAMAIPADLKEVCEAYNMPKIQRWTKLYLPCVFPSLVTGLITAMGGAWNATIVAEYLQLGKDEPIVAFGLGAIIAKATAAGEYPMLAAATVTMAIFVVLLNRFFWKHLYHLAENRYALTT